MCRCLWLAGRSVASEMKWRNDKGGDHSNCLGLNLLTEKSEIYDVFALHAANDCVSEDSSSYHLIIL